MQNPVDFQAVFRQVQQQINALQMQILRTRQVAIAAQAELALLRAGRSPRFPVEFTSQFGEDVTAWILLGEKLDGFFVEAGAFDGYRYSVTNGFEALGWTGLLVEALPGPAEECRRRRPGSRVVQAAVSGRGSSGTATFHVLEDQYGGMLSYLKPTPQHTAATNWAKRRTIEVPVTTLDALLADHNGPIDLVMIDVEGNELDVLDGFDIDRFKPRVLMIEDNSQGRDGGIQSYMSRFPYELAFRLAVNGVYVRKDDAEVQERLKWMRLG